MIQKSYSVTKYGNLYLIPTPIGNIKDITYRAVFVLNSVDKIYAEDTRETLSLLKKYNIVKKVSSCHKFTEEKHKDAIIKELIDGKNIAYVSDRGTPLISDPGEVIAKHAIDCGISVISLPGPSALLPAINMSGLDNSKFLFYGFLNSKSSIRQNELKKIFSLEYTIIFYEAPHRLLETLKDINKIMGNRNISLCREISKMHEEVYRGDVEDAIKNYQEPRGEFVIVLEGNKISDESINYVEEVKDLMKKGIKMSNAIKEIATIYGISKNVLYNDCKEKLL